MSTITKKTTKVSRTIRFDAELERQAKLFAISHHMDFTTLLHISLQNTVKSGMRLEPEMSDERIAYYQKLADDADAWIGVSKPFSTKEENRQYLLSLMSE